MIADAAAHLAVPIKAPGETPQLTETGTVVDSQFSKIRSFVVQLQNDVFSYKDVCPFCTPLSYAHMHVSAKVQTGGAQIRASEIIRGASEAAERYQAYADTGLIANHGFEIADVSLRRKRS